MPWDPPFPWLYGGGYYIWEPTPWGEGARVWVQAAAPLLGEAACRRLAGGLLTAPKGGAEGETVC